MSEPPLLPREGPEPGTRRWRFEQRLRKHRPTWTDEQISETDDDYLDDELFERATDR